MKNDVTGERGREVPQVIDKKWQLGEAYPQIVASPRKKKYRKFLIYSNEHFATKRTCLAKLLQSDVFPRYLQSGYVPISFSNCRREQKIFRTPLQGVVVITTAHLHLTKPVLTECQSFEMVRTSDIGRAWN